MYNLLEYSNNYSKISGSLLQYYKDEPNDSIADPESFKSKIKITGKTKKYWNDYTIKIFKYFLENSWNAIN